MSETIMGRNDLTVAARLRRAVKRDPDWAPFVGYWLREGLTEAAVLEELARAKRYTWLSARGYPAGMSP
jgi:hypothetical protein